MKRNIMIFALFTVLAACGSKEKQPEVPEPKVEKPLVSIETKQLGVENGSTHVAEIIYMKGSSALLRESVSKIEAVRKEATKAGKIESVKIVAWGDDEYPTAEKKTLAPTQVELAKRRASSVERLLKGKGLKSFETYNMAEQPGRFQKIFGGDEYRLKKSLEAGGIPNTSEKADTTPKKGHAMVIFIMKQES